MLGFQAIDERAPGDIPSSRAAVPIVNATQANFAFSGVAYTPTTDFSWGTVSVAGTGAVTVDVAVAAAGAHGVAAVGAVTVDAAVAAVGEHQSVTVTGTGAVTVDVAVAATGGHGVKGAGAVTVDATAQATGAHGEAGTGAVTVGVAAAATGAHGVAGTGAVTVTFTPAAVGQHLRYGVKGEVRQGGVLVNRRVRVYSRATGALLAEGDTVAGKFNLHAGFAPAEHYVVPIHLDDAATDWTPPIANRVMSVLAQDV